MSLFSELGFQEPRQINFRPDSILNDLLEYFRRISTSRYVDKLDDLFGVESAARASLQDDQVSLAPSDSASQCGTPITSHIPGLPHEHSPPNEDREVNEVVLDGVSESLNSMRKQLVGMRSYLQAVEQERMHLAEREMRIEQEEEEMHEARMVVRANIAAENATKAIRHKMAYDVLQIPGITPEKVEEAQKILRESWMLVVPTDALVEHRAQELVALNRRKPNDQAFPSQPANLDLSSSVQVAGPSSHASHTFQQLPAPSER
ncbi:hypothetical protein FRC11_001572 [Ceratobasidium sp. 423]|nr:hypothetical protein FRC11_001572 [Ceratobasidium sp. 423]